MSSIVEQPSSSLFPPSDPRDSLRLSLSLLIQSWSSSSSTILDRSHLSNVSSQLRDAREASLQTRKDLAEATKRFKKLIKSVGGDESATATPLPASSSNTTDHTLLIKETRSLVKAYQDEIDHLTKRCKLSDTAFTDLYFAFYPQIPNEGESNLNVLDPRHVLTMCQSHLDAQANQVQHLLRGMAEIQNEMEDMDVKNRQQHLDTEREWKGKVEGLERKLLEYVKKEDSWNASKSGVKTDDEKDSSGNSTSTSSSSATSSWTKEEREELMRLRREVTEYELEFKGLKNQDITIKKLNAKIEELQKSRDEEIQRELKKAQETLAHTESKRTAEALEREAALERHLASVELQLRSERAGRHATQAHLLEADEGLREREAAWEAQRQILVDDAERLRERLYQITKERDEAVMKLSAFMVDSGEDAPRFSFNSDGASIMSTDVLLEKKAYEAEVHDLSMTIASLSEEIRSKEEAMLELRRSSSAKIEAVEAENSHLLKKVNALEVEIATAPSKEAIDNMRRELRVLKKLEYNVIDVETDAEPETSTPYKSVGNEETDLETVLINKVRRIEADLLKERREKGERETEIVLLRCKNDELEVAKADSDRLIMRLEADLERAVTASNNLEILEGDKAKGISSQLGSTNTLQRILESSDAELGMTSPSPPSQKTSTLIDKTVDDHSVATIVMAQRDRLRIRCDALEAEKDSFKRELQIQVALSESLKSDNSKLFEKVKFLQSYNNTLGQVQMRAGKINADIDLEAFEQRYEASVDPFRQFSKTERMRKLKEMSPVERIVFVVAKTVLGSKEMRTFLFAYVLGMHLLVFFTTYHWAHEKGCSNLNFHHEDLQHFHGGVPRPETGPF